MLGEEYKSWSSSLCSSTVLTTGFHSFMEKPYWRNST
jgi:hypothetical protein